MYGGAGTDTIDLARWSGAYGVNMTTGSSNYGAETYQQFENLISGSGDDTITGTSGANTIQTGGGRDAVYGAGGNDMILGGGGNDLLDGQGGRDSIYGGSGNDRILGGSGNDLLNGQGGRDRIYGGSGNDLVLGGTGNDWVDAQSGSDTVRGGAGNDNLSGGINADVLIGGTGRDTFTFKTLAGSNPAGTDQLRAGDGAAAFQGAGAAAGDWIDVSDIDANATAGGNQAFVFGPPGSKGHLWCVNFGSSTRVVGNVDNDAAYEFALEIVDGGSIFASAYHADDFIL
jgi:Ca2+-binding RTX toxin-like protein